MLVFADQKGHPTFVRGTRFAHGVVAVPVVVGVRGVLRDPTLRGNPRNLGSLLLGGIDLGVDGVALGGRVAAASASVAAIVPRASVAVRRRRGGGVEVGIVPGVWGKARGFLLKKNEQNITSKNLTLKKLLSLALVLLPHRVC